MVRTGMPWAEDSTCPPPPVPPCSLLSVHCRQKGLAGVGGSPRHPACPPPGCIRSGVCGMTRGCFLLRFPTSPDTEEAEKRRSKQSEAQLAGGGCDSPPRPAAHPQGLVLPSHPRVLPHCPYGHRPTSFTPSAPPASEMQPRPHTWGRCEPFPRPSIGPTAPSCLSSHQTCHRPVPSTEQECFRST